MSIDHLDRDVDDTQTRAAEVIERATPADVPGYRMRYAVDAARALDAAGLLASPERDAEVRADERGRCSVVHATLTDDALVAELVRRGVLTEDDGGACDADARTHSVNCSCFGGSQRQRRYVTAWEPAEGDEGSTCD